MGGEEIRRIQATKQFQRGDWGERFDCGLVPSIGGLAHESIGSLVTHCGYNSVLEVLCLGLPMLAMPQCADQATNAKHVEDVWGVGIRAFPDEKGIVGRQVIKQSINEVMRGERAKEIKRNAKKWKSMAREAADECGSSDRNLDEFVAKLLRA